MIEAAEWRGGTLNSGNCTGFPVARGLALSHDPGHDSRQVREKNRQGGRQGTGQAAERRHRGRAAELSPRAGADQARRLAGGRLRRGRARSAGGSGGGRGRGARPKRIPKGIDDSKRLTAERREELFEEICATASFAVAFASPARIDRDNILRASLWALARAVRALPEMPKHVFVDGRDKIDAPCDCDAVIGGDGIVMSIAAASIIAKVTRDRLMSALALDCPGYGFENHKGYAVPEHREALDRLGPSIHHRRFFAPVVAARLKHYPEKVEETDSSKFKFDVV